MDTKSNVHFDFGLTSDEAEFLITAVHSLPLQTDEAIDRASHIISRLTRFTIEHGTYNAHQS